MPIQLKFSFFFLLFFIENKNEINFPCVKVMDDRHRRSIENEQELNFENIEQFSLLIPLSHLHHKHKEIEDDFEMLKQSTYD